jgi:hypothetical protein
MNDRLLQLVNGTSSNDGLGETVKLYRSSWLFKGIKGLLRLTHVPEQIWLFFSPRSSPYILLFLPLI